MDSIMNSIANIYQERVGTDLKQGELVQALFNEH